MICDTVVIRKMTRKGITLVFPPTSEVVRLKGGAVHAEYDNVSLAVRLTLAFITYDESRKADITILCIHRATL